jgi:hypothetical protein
MPTPSSPPRPLLPLAALLGACGVVAMLIGWIKVSAAAHVDRQVSWSSLSLIGAVLICAAAGLAATSGERVFLLHLNRLAAAVPLDTSQPVTGRPAEVVPDQLVAAPTMARYHRADCPLAAGKPVTADTRVAHERAGRQPCGVCGA